MRIRHRTLVYPHEVLYFNTIETWCRVLSLREKVNVIHGGVVTCLTCASYNVDTRFAIIELFDTQ